MADICAECNKILDQNEHKYSRTDGYGASQILCEKCFKESAGEYFFERQALAKLGCSTPLWGFIIAIIAYVFWGWKACLVVVGITILLTVYFSTLLQHFVNKMWAKKGMDPKNLKWCKTCKNYRKRKDWEFKLHYSKELLSEDKIPCRIFLQTKEVWERYFATPEGEKTLYPKNYCTLWVKR